MIGISKKEDKKESLRLNFSFALKDIKEPTQKYIDELNLIETIINEHRLFICDLPVVMFNGNVYIIEDTHTFIEIYDHIKSNGYVLLFTPIMVNNEIHFNCKLL